jgi:hypothetical protein
MHKGVRCVQSTPLLHYIAFPHAVILRLYRANGTPELRSTLRDKHSCSALADAMNGWNGASHVQYGNVRITVVWTDIDVAR